MVLAASAALWLVAQEPTPAPLDLGAVTVCFRDALADGRSGRDCIDLLAAPCAPFPEEARVGCLDRLAEAFGGRARAQAARVAPFYTDGEHAQLTAAVEGRLLAVRERCDGGEEGVACRLHGAALIAHLVEFHPERFVETPERAT